jgi:hypothetical protein
VAKNVGNCHGAVNAFLHEDGSTVNLNTLVALSPLAPR